MTKNKPKVKKTTTDPETGHELAHYESGVIRDNTAGRLIHGPTDPALNPIIADPHAMHRRRYELALQRSWQSLDDEAIAQGLIDLSRAGSGEGYYQLCRKLDALLFNAKSLREIEGILPVRLRMLELGATNKIEISNRQTNIYNASDKAIRELVEFMRQAQEPILEGETHE